MRVVVVEHTAQEEKREYNTWIWQVQLPHIVLAFKADKCYIRGRHEATKKGKTLKAPPPPKGGRERGRTKRMPYTCPV